MKHLVISTLLAAVMASTGILLGASSAAAAQTPQQAVDQGASSAASQGYNQHVSVRDRQTGVLLAQSPNANQPTASESLVKLFTATREIVAGYGNYRNVPTSELDALAYMIEYSDDASENARYTSDDVPWVVNQYGLSGNTAAPSGGEWGAASITANDETLFLYRMLQDPAVGPWMTAVMAQSQPNGSDGFNQHFGFNALGGVHGSKQGWGSDGFNGRANTISSVGYTDRYVGAILSTAGTGGGYTEMEAPETYTAQLIQRSSTPPPTPPPAPLRVSQGITNVAAANGKLAVSGWTFDPANPGRTTTVTLYVNGTARMTIDANMPQSYVNSVYHVPGNHGFTIRLPAGPGTYAVRFVGNAASGSNSTPASSRTLTVKQAPPGDIARGLASAVTAGSRVTVKGWAYDPTNTADWTTVTIYIDGKNAATVPANRPYSAVNRLLHVPGNHGFEVRLLITPGRHHHIVFAAHALQGSSSIPGMSRSLTTN